MDRFALFQCFWNRFIENYRKYYAVRAYVTVDEQLIPFRGRVPSANIRQKTGKILNEIVSYEVVSNWLYIRSGHNYKACPTQDAKVIKGELSWQNMSSLLFANLYTTGINAILEPVLHCQLVYQHQTCGWSLAETDDKGTFFCHFEWKCSICTTDTTYLHTWGCCTEMNVCVECNFCTQIACPFYKNSFYFAINRRPCLFL